jgi:acyl-CoA thioester hydrolase
MGASITLRRRLDWADTDAAGFWHHSTFWKYAEAGEAQLARDLGISDLLFGATPRRTVAAEFHRPVYFDDEIDITFAVEAVGRTSATYHVRIDCDGELAADGRMVVVLVDDAGRPRPWPDTVAAVLGGDPPRD